MKVELKDRKSVRECSGCFGLCESCFLYFERYNQPNYVKKALKSLEERRKK